MRERYGARLRTTCVVSLLVAASSWGPARAAEALQPEIETLVGVYRFAGGPSESREVERAIDDAVDEMNVFVRGIARRRLKEPNLPTEELRIVLEEDRITVVRTGQPPISAPADGKPVTWRNPKHGNELQVTHRVTSVGALQQVLVGERGVSTNLFVISDDGRLRVRTTIEADLLPSTVRFSATYARK